MIGADQIGIMFTGAVAIYLTQSSNSKWRRCACLFGMAGQPFWYWAAYSAHQYGILAISTLYTFSWMKGVWQYWVKPWWYLRGVRVGSA